MATKAQRAHLHALMQLLEAHGSQVLYPAGDVRTAADLSTFKLTEQELEQLLLAGRTIQGDCSEVATELCRWAGLADPNGLGYRYPGYTGTMLSHLPHYSEPHAAQIGALCVFGPGTGEHVCTVYTPGDDPLLFSHGAPGVRLLPLSTERQYHRSPVTFLSIAHL